jgi:hypothetical protein
MVLMRLTLCKSIWHIACPESYLLTVATLVTSSLDDNYFPQDDIQSAFAIISQESR